MGWDRRSGCLGKDGAVKVPARLSQLDPALMTTALARRCPGALVDEVAFSPVGRGTNTGTRVLLGYSRGSGPPSVFVKTGGRLLHRFALVALGAFATESRWAASGIDLPLEHPRPYAGAVDWSRLASLVVLDDLALAGGEPNDARQPLAVPRVAAGLDGLARLHAAYWERPLPQELSFLRPWRLRRSWAPVSLMSLRAGMRRLGSGTAELSAVCPPPLLERQFRASARLATAGPQTVLHGDPHPGNTYSLPAERTGFCDWQLLRTGSWSHDVGYFLVSALAVEERRRSERELLAGYLEALGRCGVEPPEPEQAWERYRASPAFGLATWVHTLAFATLQPRAVCEETIARFLAAYQDLGTRSCRLLES